MFIHRCPWFVREFEYIYLCTVYLVQIYFIIHTMSNSFIQYTFSFIAYIYLYLKDY